MTIPSSSSLRSSILRRAFRIAGTVVVASSGTWPQNAALLRSGHCTRPRHTDFGLSLTRAAAPTPAACSLPVAYGVRPVPAPCSRARPCALGTALRCAATASQEPSTSAFPRHLHLIRFQLHGRYLPTLVYAGRQCLGDPTWAGPVPGHAVGLDSRPLVPLATTPRR